MENVHPLGRRLHLSKSHEKHLLVLQYYGNDILLCTMLSIICFKVRQFKVCYKTCVLKNCMFWLRYCISTSMLWNTLSHTHTDQHTHTPAAMECSSSGRPSYLRIVQGQLTAQHWWLPWARPLTRRPLMNTPDSHTATWANNSTLCMTDSWTNESERVQFSTTRGPSESVFPIVSTFTAC